MAGRVGLNTIDIRKWKLKVSSNVLHIWFQTHCCEVEDEPCYDKPNLLPNSPTPEPKWIFFWRSLRTCNVDVITMPRHHSKRGLMGKLGGSGWQLHWSLDPWVHDWMFEWQEFNHPCDSGVSVFDRIPAVYCRWFIIVIPTLQIWFSHAVAKLAHSSHSGVGTHGGIGRSWGWGYRLGWLEVQNIVYYRLLKNGYRIEHICFMMLMIGMRCFEEAPPFFKLPRLRCCETSFEHPLQGYWQHKGHL